MKQHNIKLGSEIGNGWVNPFIVSAEEQVSYKYKCRLYGAYDSSEDFLYTLEVLEQAKEEDLVELHLSGPGGSLDAVITLLHAMDKCACPVHVLATGTVASAATLPILNAHSFEAHPYTSFMFHAASFSVPHQKTQDVWDEVKHTKERCETIMREEYKHFFTEEELDAMMNGKQFWLNAEEFTERYNKRNEIMQAEMMVEAKHSGEENESM